MSNVFWIRRFAIALTGAFAAITLGQVLLRGRALEDAIPHALSWGIVAASIFVASAYYRWRRNQHCALCRDLPEA